MTPFLGWIHRDSTEATHFVALQTETQKICLTPKHVIFRRKHGQKTGTGSTSFADQVEEGDHLQVLSSGMAKVRWEAVLSIQVETKRGFYAPLTSTGTLIVDNVLASCYANFLHQSVVSNIESSTWCNNHHFSGQHRITANEDVQEAARRQELWVWGRAA